MTTPVSDQSVSDDAQLRARALKQLKKQRDFWAHLIVYVLVNTCLVVIWDLSSSGFFWPIFPIGFWGIGVVMNAWDVWHGENFTDEQITREMDRLRGIR